MRLEDADYNAFCDYWHQLPRAKGQLLPAKSALKPAEIKKMLPFIFILQAKENMMLEVRLTGTALDMLAVESLTGKNYLDICPPSEKEIYWEATCLMREHPCGFVALRDITFSNGKGYRLKSIVFPMLDQCDAPNFMLGLTMPNRFPEGDIDWTEEAAISSKLLEMEVVDIGAGIPVDFEKLAKSAGFQLRT
jgi:hypothetical protein